MNAVQKTGATVTRHKRAVEEWLPYARQQADRFWSHVDKSGECWIWQLSTDKDGYGKFQVSLPRLRVGKQEQCHVRAHRLAYILTHGPVEDRLLILHSCDNPRCCRPDHLRPGTQLENRADAVKRNRVARGERHAQAKLTEAQAREALSMRRAGVPTRELMKRFGVSKATIEQIGTYHWRHIA